MKTFLIKTFLMKKGIRSTAQIAAAGLLLLGLSGCAAMEGVNVGASVPIGGIVNVGANKTIGQNKPTNTNKNPQPTQAPPTPAPAEDEED